MNPLPDIGADYVVQRPWRSSGEAELYFAQHIQGGRHVVKLPHHVDDVRPWLAWVERQRQLSHPRILEIRDAGIAKDPPGRPFMVTEHFVWESTLRDLLRQRGALPEGLVRQIVQAILEGLAYAHAHSPMVVHRDLKPENVLLTTRGSRLLELKLIDFSPDRISGTPPYRAPELGSAGAEPSPATDVFSVGVIAYELLTGGPPVPVGDGGDREAAVAALAGLDYGAPALRGWEGFLRGCLAPERGRRFAEAASALAGLEASAVAAPVAPTPQRRVALRLIAAMIAVVFLMVLAVAVKQASDSRRERPPVRPRPERDLRPPPSRSSPPIVARPEGSAVPLGAGSLPFMLEEDWRRYVSSEEPPAVAAGTFRGRPVLQAAGCPGMDHCHLSVFQGGRVAFSRAVRSGDTIWIPSERLRSGGEYLFVLVSAAHRRRLLDTIRRQELEGIAPEQVYDRVLLERHRWPPAASWLPTEISFMRLRYEP